MNQQSIGFKITLSMLFLLALLLFESQIQDQKFLQLLH